MKMNLLWSTDMHLNNPFVSKKSRWNGNYRYCLPLFLIIYLSGYSADAQKNAGHEDERKRILDEMEYSLQEELLAPWYPSALDEENGGFLSTFSYDWTPVAPQDKMIVTQARHVWVNAKAAKFFPEVQHYKENAKAGFYYLKDVMWDNIHGGFHTLTDQKGKVKSKKYEEKTAYGNAFAIYALAEYYHVFKDTSALNLAIKTFHWLETHSHDPVHKGYFQILAVDGQPLQRTDTVSSVSEIGYKDQNSSIHLLEAFTTLYEAWPDRLLRERLQEMLFLIRDTITTDSGYMNLFFEPDWTPVSFKDSSEEVIHKHHGLDHVSFGHDVETAFLMLEASHALALEDDTLTLLKGKKMVDHALLNGWDGNVGGFYDGGYYFKGDDDLTIVRDTKNWWAQAEGLNTLLLMADHFPEDRLNYFEKFRQLWSYIQQYLIDHEHGGWYQGGLDKQPEMKTALKGQIWKAAYHNYRSLENCITRLRTEETPSPKAH